MDDLFSYIVALGGSTGGNVELRTIHFSPFMEFPQYFFIFFILVYSVHLFTG